LAKKPTTQSEPDNSGSTPFIDSQTANEAYVETKRWMRTYFDPIDEYERLVRGKPSNNIPKELPKVTDGTIASIIQDDPKRVIQQEPTGLVSCEKYPEYAKVADYELTNTLIPMANRQGSELQKDWIITGKALGWGRAASYTFYTSTNGRFHADFVIPYVKDVLSEKGKVFAPDSNIVFMRSWYQKRDIKAIINKEKAMMEQIKGYKSDWDLKLLADFMEGGASAKPAEVMTPAEREKGGDTGGFEVIHAFQVGKGAEWYSFSPQFEDGVNLRTKISNDPRGNIPIDFLYYEIDLSNPLGRGIPEAQGGKQNLIDQQMQMFQFTSTLMQAPPAITFGNVKKSTMRMVPNAVWDGGSSPQNRVDFVKIDNTQIANFANNYGLLKSQILQGAASNQTATISADAGNPSFSKTQAGVNAQQSQMNISDNYLRKQFEDWKGRQWETAINIYFNEMQGKSEPIKLEADEVKEFAKTEAKQFITKDHKLVIPYKEIDKVAFQFNVNPSSSEIKEDQDNVEKLTEVYKILQSDPDPSLADKKTKLLKILIDEIGAEGTDDLFPELDDNQQDPMNPQPQQQQMTPQMVQQMIMQAMQQYDEANKQKSLAESMKWTSADFTANELAQLKAQLNIHPDPSGAATPNQVDAQVKAHDTISKAQLAEDTHHFNVQKAAVDTLQNADQAQQSHELAVQGQDQQTQQAQAQNAPEQGESEPQGQADAEPIANQLSPGEEQVVHELFNRGFNENDIEQAITMLRNGVHEQQIIQALGAKKGALNG
jgi:hypothetical protein